MGKRHSSISKDETNELLESTKFKKDELKEWFRAFKTDCPNGLMTRDQFCDLYHKIYSTEQRNIVKTDLLFRSFDHNDDGNISFSELMTTLSVLRRGPMREKMEWLFDIYDIDGNGEISFQELTGVVECLRDRTKYKFNMDQMGAIFENMDSSKDGSLSKEEFLEGVQSHPDLINLMNSGQVKPIV